MADHSSGFLVKSKFVLAAMLPRVLLKTVLISAVCTGLLGTTAISLMILKGTLHSHLDALRVLSKIFAAFAIPVLLYRLFKQWLSYATTEFIFFEDHVEATRRFLTVDTKSIAYNRISETGMRTDLAQRYFGLGTITFMTSATPNLRDNNPGFDIPDVDDAAAAFEKIKRLVSQKG